MMTSGAIVIDTGFFMDDEWYRYEILLDDPSVPELKLMIRRDLRDRQRARLVLILHELANDLEKAAGYRSPLQCTGVPPTERECEAGP